MKSLLVTDGSLIVKSDKERSCFINFGQKFSRSQDFHELFLTFSIYLEFFMLKTEFSFCKWTVLVDTIMSYWPPKLPIQIHIATAARVANGIAPS